MRAEQKITFGEMRADGVRSVVDLLHRLRQRAHITVPDDADRCSRGVGAERFCAEAAALTSGPGQANWAICCPLSLIVP